MLNPPLRPVLSLALCQGQAAAPMPSLLEQTGLLFTPSGRTAIHLALQAWGIGPGDQVLVPTYHCPSMVAPVHACGASPLFYPTDATGAPLLSWLRDGPARQAKVLLVAHFFGLPQPLQALRAWCDEHGIRLLEDCAHALFGRSEGRAIGAWGDAAIGSLTKFLPVPEGGVLHLAQGERPALRPAGAARSLKAGLKMLDHAVHHGRLPWLGPPWQALQRWRQRGRPAATAPARQDDGAAPTDQAVIREHALAADASARQAAAPCRWVALRAHRERIVGLRRQHYQHLVQAWQAQPGLRPLFPELPPDCAPYMVPVWLDQPDAAYQRLRQQGFPVARWDVRWPGTPQIDGDVGGLWARHVIQVPCHQDLRADELDAVAQAVRDCVGGAPAARRPA